VFVENTKQDEIQDAAEIVKHFKILVMCFSARVWQSTGIWTYAV